MFFHTNPLLRLPSSFNTRSRGRQATGPLQTPDFPSFPCGFMGFMSTQCSSKLHETSQDKIEEDGCEIWCDAAPISPCHYCLRRSLLMKMLSGYQSAPNNWNRRRPHRRRVGRLLSTRAGGVLDRPTDAVYQAIRDWGTGPAQVRV